MAKLKNLRTRQRGKKGVIHYEWFCNKTTANKYGVPSFKNLGTNQQIAFQKWSKYNEQITNKKTSKKEYGFIPILSSNTIKDGSLAHMTEIYFTCRNFKNLAKRTQENYISTANRLNNKLIFETQKQPLGTKQIATFDRFFCMKLYDKLLSKGTRTANNYIQTLSQIINTARNYGFYTFENPCTNMNLEHNKPRDQVWSEDEFNLFVKTASESGYDGLKTAMLLGFYTAQRQTDLLNMTWDWFDDDLKYLKIMQSKTKAKVEIPVYMIKPLYDYLLDLKNKSSSEFVVVDFTDNKPYNNRVRLFGERFENIRQKSGVRKELLFRDLRRTSILKLQEVGCTPEQISSISGHSLKTIYNMLDVYAPKTRAKAEQAFSKLFGK